jgi:hypothetical protein
MRLADKGVLHHIGGQGCVGPRAGRGDETRVAVVPARFLSCRCGRAFRSLATIVSIRS